MGQLGERAAYDALMHPASQRPSDALTRVAVGAVVPAVAVAAHGVAGGGIPGAAGLLVSVAIGGLLGCVAHSPRRTRTAAMVTTTLLLSFAQVACHWALAVGDAGHAMHQAGGPGMLVMHAIAIPVSAVLLVLAATLADVVTSTIRSMTPPPVLRTPAQPRMRWVEPLVSSGPVLGGPGVRGPPVTA